MNTMGLAALAASLALALATAPAAADAAYKCGQRTYSDRPCSGGRLLGATAPHRLDRHAVPPQDRARLARRAELEPHTRHRCEALDGQLAQQASALARLPQPATPGEERELLQTKLKYRRLHC